MLWLVLSRSGFCSTDRFHGNGPIRVFLFRSKAGKFKICNQNSEKCECCHSSLWNYQKKLKRLKFFRNFKDGWRRRTFLCASHRKCILLSETECHIINYLLTELARAVPGNIGPQSFLHGPRCARSVLSRPRANIPQYGPRARLVRGYYLIIFHVKTVTRVNRMAHMTRWLAH